MSQLMELRDKRGQLVADARAILDRAEAEKRVLTADESQQYDTVFSESEKAKNHIAQLERQQELERETAQTVIDKKAPVNPQDSVMDDFRSHLVNSRIPANASQPYAALQADADTAGGYIVTPTQFVSELLKNVDNETLIRKKATVFQVNQAASLGVPSLDANPADATWGTELDLATSDSTMAFGKRELFPHELTALIKVSMKLQRLSNIPIDQLMAERLGYVFGITEEQAFMTGSGAGKPLGLFTASNDGIPTSRDVSTGNSTTSMQVDGLHEAKYSLKSQYQKVAEWLFHRDGVKQISKLKDGEGQYLWQPSIVQGQPDLLLGRPVNVSEYAPNTFTTGLYVGLFGDLSKYWIADSLVVTLQRLVELYAATNQVGYIGRAAVDGMPVLSEAFSRVKLA